MITNIYFVRHAHSIYAPNEYGRPLSKQGLLDAKKVTNILKREKINQVYSSPYKRALQTVEGIANTREKEIIIVDDLKERILAKAPVDDFSKAIKKVWYEEDFSWDGGESNRIAQARGVDTLLQILNEHKGEQIVIGTHGNIMVLMMNYFDHQYGFEFWKRLTMPDIYRLSFRDSTLVKVNWLWGER